MTIGAALQRSSACSFCCPELEKLQAICSLPQSIHAQMILHSLIVPSLQGGHLKDVERCDLILADRSGRQRACGQDNGQQCCNRASHQGAFQSGQLGTFGEEGAGFQDEAVPVRRTSAVGQFRRHVRQACSHCREREDGTGRRILYSISFGLLLEGCTGASTARLCRYWTVWR